MLMPTFITPDRELSRHPYSSYAYLFYLSTYLSVYLHTYPPPYSCTPLPILPHILMPLLTPHSPYGIHHSVGSYESHSHCLAFHPTDFTQ